jgi:hypothetical protein
MLSFRSLASAFIMSLVPLAAYAETAPATDSEKIDSIFVMQKQVVRTIKNDPLADKTFGVEFNFLRVLMLTEQTSLSGGVSLFNVHRQAEIAFPFLYSKSKTADIDGPWADSLSNVDFTEFTQDVHYRYFLGNTQNGFYLSGFARGAYLSGIKGSTEFDVFDSTKAGNARDTEMKMGLGVGLGYRKFSYRGLYWGAGINLGRYVIGENDKFRGGLLSYDNDSELIIDIELFKFGWAF